jgi:hypothetical protein
MTEAMCHSGLEEGALFQYEIFVFVTKPLVGECVCLQTDTVPSSNANHASLVQRPRFSNTFHQMYLRAIRMLAPAVYKPPQKPKLS